MSAKTGFIVIVTAVLAAAAASLFWIFYFNQVRPASPDGDPLRAEREGRSETAMARLPDDRLVIGPEGMAVPVLGARSEELVDTFADARAAGERVHDAIDIMAPRGTPVIAAAPGIVERIFFSDGGGGKTVYVRSPDRRWIYYYAHLADYAPGLKEGQRVERGDLLGEVGSTGNASESAPHLHFAVHRMHPEDDWHGGEPVNPYPLLTGRGRAPEAELKSERPRAKARAESDDFELQPNP
ncbi:MAG: M23 family metallopeptidase [Sphingomonadaceae bacterium]